MQLRYWLTQTCYAVEQHEWSSSSSRYSITSILCQLNPINKFLNSTKDVFSYTFQTKYFAYSLKAAVCTQLTLQSGILNSIKSDTRMELASFLIAQFHVSYKYWKLFLFYRNNYEGIRSWSHLMEGQAKKAAGVLTSALSSKLQFRTFYGPYFTPVFVAGLRRLGGASVSWSVRKEFCCVSYLNTGKLLSQIVFPLDPPPVAYPGIFFGGGGGSTNSVEDRENGDLGGGNPLVRDSGGSCNLVQ